MTRGEHTACARGPRGEGGATNIYKCHTPTTHVTGGTRHLAKRARASQGRPRRCPAGGGWLPAQRRLAVRGDVVASSNRKPDRRQHSYATAGALTTRPHPATDGRVATTRDGLEVPQELQPASGLDLNSRRSVRRRRGRGDLGRDGTRSLLLLCAQVWRGVGGRREREEEIRAGCDR